MIPRRALLLIAAATAPLGFCIANEAKPAGAETAAVVGAPGPVERRIPDGASVAGDEQTLARWLHDPDGPREIWLRARDYSGDFVAGRPVTLRGERGATIIGSGNGTVLTLSGQGSELDNVIVRRSGRRHTREDAAIKAIAPDIVIRRVEARDSLFGIVLGPCPRCRVEDSRVVGDRADSLQGDGIKLWEASDAVVERSLVQDSRDVVVWYSRRVLLRGNRVTGSRYGAHFMYAHDSVVRDSVLERNVVGIFVMYSSRMRLEHNVLAGARGPAGVGVGFKESDGATLIDNAFVANTAGAYLDRTPRSPATPVRFERNHFALNDVALRLHSSQRGFEAHANDFASNAGIIEVEGGGDALDAKFFANRWSDYRGYDLDRDGRGDVPYQVEVLSSELTERAPSLKLFEGTLAIGAIDLVARAAPVFAAKLLLVDPSPRFGAGKAER